MKKVLLIVLCVVAPVLCVCIGAFYFKKTEKTGEETIAPVFATELSGAVSDALQDKWYKDGDKVYYLSEGIPVTGWQELEGYKYFFDEKGVLQTNTTVENHQFVDGQGRLVDKRDVYAKGKEGYADLREMLEQQISSYYGVWSIYVKNLDKNEYMVINNEPIQAASVVKVFNMAAIYEQEEMGLLERTEMVDNLMYKMIAYSDNASYNSLLAVIGGKEGRRGGLETIMDFCEEHDYKDTVVGSTISADESGIAPVWIATNYTTVQDMGHFLEDIYRGNLVSEKASDEMLSLLRQQQLNWKIPAGLPEGVECAHKTGEYEDREHDAAIVFSEGADYILVIMTRRDGGAINHIQAVSSTVYRYFNPEDNRAGKYDNVEMVTSKEYKIEVAPSK